MKDEITGQLLFISSLLAFEFARHYRAHTHYESAYWGERRGRVRVEQEIKRLTEVQLNTSDGFFIQPIATIESCYKQCVGTPRQGLLVPSSRAILKLTRNVSPEALDGLDEFSHVWLSFKFHLNTNSLKEAKAFQGAIESKTTYTFTAKITPPMLKEKKGVFATRSPHRPNPIGVTLAKIESVDKSTRSLLLSACDLVEGTPIIDIKPYVPSYDTVIPFRVPTWIMETIETRNTVIIRNSIREDVMKIQNKLKLYKNNVDLFLVALQETLEADVRSKFQTKRRIADASNGVTVDVPFDQTIVRYFWIEDRTMEVERVLLASDCIDLNIEREMLHIDQE